MKKAKIQEVVSKPAEDLSAKRDQELIPVALEIFSRIATREDLKLGDNKNLGIDEAVEYYQDIYRQEIVPTLLSHNVPLNSIKFLFETVLLPLERLQDTFNSIGKDEEAIALAKAILATLGAHKDLLVGSIEKKEVQAYYRKVWDEEIVPIVANAKFGVVSYVFLLLRQPFQLISDLTISSLEMNKEIADALKWGVKETGDIRIADLDNALKNGTVTADASLVDKPEDK